MRVSHSSSAALFLCGLAAIAQAVSCGGSRGAESSRVVTNRVDHEGEPAPRAPARITVRGTVTGHHGKPLALAHVHHGMNSIELEPDGRYEIEVPDRGFAELYVTGVDSVDYRLLLYADGEDIDLDIRLGTYRTVADFSKVAVFVEGMGSFSQAIPMNKQSDGTYAVTISTPENQLAYELVNVATRNSVNGTMGTGHRYDGDGNYFSLVESGGAEVTIVFDPSKLWPPDQRTLLTFGNEKSNTAQITRVAQRVRERQRTLLEQLPSGSPENPSQSSQSEYDKLVQDVLQKIEQTGDPFLRQALLIEYFTLTQPSLGVLSATASADSPERRALALRAKQAIPSDSPLWRIEPYAVLMMLAATGEPLRHRPYVDDIIERYPDKEVGAVLVVPLLVRAYEEGDTENLERYYRIIKKRFAGMPVSRMADNYNPERKIRPGARIPAFSLQSMDDGSKRLTDTGLLGQVYLVEFWATWCKPCIAEMPKMHEIYAQYKDRGFTILSIAFQDDRGAVQAFRAGKFPMPWNHVFVDSAREDEISAAFEIYGLPTLILVDREGRIVRVNQGLRGEQLRATLDSVLSHESGSN